MVKMSQRRVQIVILCEDKQQEVFAIHFLKKRGFTLDRNFRTEICPKGAGEQFVREKYAKEVVEYRRRRNRRSGMLIVLIDADKKTVEERLKQLNDALIENSQQLRQPNEAIAVFVPKRNIETWIHYLQGTNVDEETEYTKLKKQSDCKPYVEKLVNQCSQGNLDEKTPPSLKAACGELQRILPLIE
jgi:phenylalanyl-tRNA synthetase alpha subunit